MLFDVKLVEGKRFAEMEARKRFQSFGENQCLIYYLAKIMLNNVGKE